MFIASLTVRYLAVFCALVTAGWLGRVIWRSVRRGKGPAEGVTTRNPGPPGGYHFIGWSLERMPDWFNRWGKHLGTTLALWTLPKQRAASREYLRLVLHREPTWDEMWRHINGFTEYLCLRLAICQGARPEVCFAPGDGNELRAWIARGRPALYGTVHVGRSDLVGFFLSELGEHVHMIRRQVGNSEDTRRLAQRFERSVTFIWINDWSRLVLAMNDALRAGCSLAMQCDRPEHSSKHADFQFLGARRVFPFTIYHLAIMHEMPVVMSYAVPAADNPLRTVVHMPPMFFPRPERGRQENFAAAREHFQAFLTEIEGVLEKNPYLWFNFLPMNAPFVPDGGGAEQDPVARRVRLQKFQCPVAGEENEAPANSPSRGNGVLT